MERSTGAPCPLPRGYVRISAPSTSLPEPRWRRCWRGSGAGGRGASAGGARTTSCPSAALRCSPPTRSPRSARRWGGAGEGGGPGARGAADVGRGDGRPADATSRRRHGQQGRGGVLSSDSSFKLSAKRLELLRALRREQGLAATREEGIPRRPDAESYPLSFNQERLWFLDRLQPGSVAYNLPVALRLQGPLRLAAPAGALPAEARAAEVRRLLREEALRPFDLELGPIFRFSLLRLGPEDHAVLVTVHHIAADALSLEIFIRELSLLYAGQELPELPIRYADFACWQREWAQGGGLDEQLAYWRQRLRGAPTELELPGDRQRPATRRFQVP